jgi:Ferredoxin thioredoxin reductase variable alpha chain
MYGFCGPCGLPPRVPAAARADPAAAAIAAPKCCAEKPSRSRFAKGDRVRVRGPLPMYHVAGRMGEEVDVGGRTGEVFKVIDAVKGVNITATKPVVVRLEEDGRKFVAHFDDDELETAA